MYCVNNTGRKKKSGRIQADDEDDDELTHCNIGYLPEKIVGENPVKIDPAVLEITRDKQRGKKSNVQTK